MIRLIVKPLLFVLVLVPFLIISYGSVNIFAEENSPTLTITSPDKPEGEVGTLINLKGQGFFQRTSVKITFGDQPVTVNPGFTQTDKNGDFLCSIKVPHGEYAGKKEITANVGMQSASVSFTVLASLESPETARPGETIKISGTGFHPNAELRVYIGSDFLKECKIVANSYGEFIEQDIHLSDTLNIGDTTLKLEDDSDSLQLIPIEKPLTIVPISSTSNTTASAVDNGSILIITSPDKPEGKIGTLITLEGQGFPPQISIEISFSNKKVKTIENINTLQTQSNGYFKYTIKVPRGEYAGKKEITATVGTQSASVPFIVLASLESPETAQAGETIKISGTGFHPNMTLNVYIGESDDLIANIITDSNGEFSNEDIPLPAQISPGETNFRVEESIGIQSITQDRIILINPPVKTGFDWWLYIVIGIGILVIGAFLALLIDRKILSPNLSDINYDKQNLKKIEKDYWDLDRAYKNLKKNYEVNEGFKRQVPSLTKTFISNASQLKSSYPDLAKTSMGQLLDDPGTEYWAIYERNRALEAIRSYFDSLEVQGKTLKADCLSLINRIKATDPELYDILNPVVNEANVYGLSAIKPVLVQIYSHSASFDISPQIRTELVDLEKSLENIRDYRYRLIPSRLVSFAKELIATPATSKENAIRERIVLKIISFVKEYLSM